MADPDRLPVGPLNYQVPIAEPQTGRPTPEFMRKWAEQAGFNGDIKQLTEWLLELRAKVIIAGSGLDGGGVLGDPGDITIELDPAQPWHPQGYIDGKPDAGMVVFKLLMKTGYAVPNDLAGSLFESSAAATASSVFSVRHNGVSIGNVTFGAGSNVGVATVAGFTAADYDTFEFIAPLVQDATLSGVSFLFIGTRPVTP